MAKHGGPRHWKRLAVPRSIKVTDKKAYTWMVRPHPGPHTGKTSIPLAVLLRDILKYAKTLKEAETILHRRLVWVDGAVRTEAKFPVGFMDVVDLPQAGKTYRILVDTHGRLLPMEITSSEKKSKLGKIIQKYVLPGNKMAIRLHDGKVLQGDANLRVGDSVRIALPKPAIQQVIRLEPGARCLIREGKHAGMVATLDKIMERKGRPAEARLKNEKEEFITVAKYLFAVDTEFRMG